MASHEPVFSNLIRFGKEFELDLGAYELRRAGQPIKLGRIPMELLRLLIEQRGQLVTRDQMVERVWGKGVFVDTDNSINAAIRRVRQILDDAPEQPQFVQTIVGRGYRFIANIQEASAEEVGESSTEVVQGSDHFLGKKVSHYRILKMLGGGGMGLVYMAEDLVLSRRVALKFLPAEFAENSLALDRLVSEARAASALDHPNTCPVYELGKHEGRPFIVMQLLEGETLREWIDQSPARDNRSRSISLLDLAVQIAAGLESAHRKGIIHRDIKPANIFITCSGQVKILDFGMAKFMERAQPWEDDTGEDAGFCQIAASPTVTQTGATLGTPSYLSPEQIRHEPLDARSDLFSFGLVLYEMATGQRAFSGNTAQSIRDAVLNHPPIAPRAVNPDVPIRLEEIILKSIEKDAAHRYQSALDLGSDLSQVKSCLTPASRPRGIAIPLAVGALALMTLVAITSVGKIRKLRASEAPSRAVAQVQARHSIAVLGFKNLSQKPELAWISTALSEMLSADLALGHQLRLIPGENVARMKMDLGLPSADSYGTETLGRIRGRLGSDMVVLGSYLAVAQNRREKIHVNMLVQDARTGETICAISEDGGEADLPRLVAQSADSLRKILHITGISENEATQVD